MSAPTTIGIRVPRREPRHAATVVALIVLVMIAVLGAFLLTRPETSAPTAGTSSALVRTGAGNCETSQVVIGGLIEGHTVNDRCGESGVTRVPHGLQE